jgi:hypothetical protein
MSQQRAAGSDHVQAVSHVIKDIAASDLLLVLLLLLLLLLLSGFPPLGPFPVCVRCNGGSSEGLVTERCVT